MQRSSLGVDENIAGALCYLLGVLTGAVFYLLEKESKFVRFHAVQSMVVFGGILVFQIVLSAVGAVLGSIPVLGAVLSLIFVGLLSMLVAIASIVLWLVLMYRAYRGETWKVPVAGGIAERYA